MPKDSEPLAKRMWRLDRNQKILRNQKEVLDALELALQLADGRADWYDKADGLMLLVAGEMFRTCEQIAEDSGVAQALLASE